MVKMTQKQLLIFLLVNIKQHLSKIKSGISNAKNFNIDNSNVRLGEIIQVFSKKDVHNAIKELKYSIGHDDIHSNHLKLCTPLFEDFIVAFFFKFY